MNPGEIIYSEELDAIADVIRKKAGARNPAFLKSTKAGFRRAMRGELFRGVLRCLANEAL